VDATSSDPTAQATIRLSSDDAPAVHPFEMIETFGWHLDGLMVTRALGIRFALTVPDDEESLKRKLSTIKRIERGLADLQSKVGPAGTFGWHVVRVGGVVGASGFTVQTPEWVEPRPGVFLAADAANAIDDALAGAAVKVAAEPEPTGEKKITIGAPAPPAEE
jgi:hypothetical protein